MQYVSITSVYSNQRYYEVTMQTVFGLAAKQTYSLTLACDLLRANMLMTSVEATGMAALNKLLIHLIFTGVHA
jgi:hypothetical protein